tara:strand:+ start:2669 stop:3454 length:786 start_codon:yes stop_codon:yes gene_type:complete
MNNYKITKNYTFHLWDFNRDIDETNLKNIKESIERSGLLQPIKVVKRNGHFYVFDGQHRYLACRELNIPVKYVIEDNVDLFSMLELNNHSKLMNSWDIIKVLAIGTENITFKKTYDLAKWMVSNTTSYNKLSLTNAVELLHVSGNPKGLLRKITDANKLNRFNIDSVRAKNIFECLNIIADYSNNTKGNLMTAYYIRGFKKIYNDYGKLNTEVIKHISNDIHLPSNLKNQSMVYEFFNKLYDKHKNQKRFYTKKPKHRINE